MIDAIDWPRLRNDEFLACGNGVVSIVETNDPVALNLVPQITAYKNKLTECSELYVLERANANTQDMNQLDQRRDLDISGIVMLLDAYTRHFDAGIVRAATLLLNNTKLFGTGIARKSLMAETTSLKELIADWETKPLLTAAITELNLVAWKDDLKATNTAFELKYMARTHDYGTATTDTLKGKRLESMDAYYNLKKYLEAYALINNTAIYTNTISDVNALIAQFNTLLASRMTDTGEEGNLEEGGTNDEGGIEITPINLP